MARLIRGLFVIGTIAIHSPVHEAASLRQDALSHGRTLISTLMPIASTAKQISDMDPVARDVMLSVAAAHLTRADLATPYRNQRPATSHP